MNGKLQHQLLNQQVIDLEESIIQLEQILIHFEQCDLFSLHTGVKNRQIADYKLFIKPQETAIKKLEVEYQLAVEKLEFASLTM